MEILTLFSCFSTLTSTTSIRHLTVIAEAIFSMTGRVTMLGISRWTSEGGSYRTVQRFFTTAFLWTALHIKFVESHLFNPSHEYILAGDATTITKSGKNTFGINRFFSGVLGIVVKGIEFFAISLIDVTTRQSYPLGVKQTIREKTEPTRAAKRKKWKPKKPRKKVQSKPANLKGRPAGVLNKDKMKLELSSELLRIHELLQAVLQLLRVFVEIKYLALDGHYGHNQAVLMARENCLELIGKMRKDAVLCSKYEGEQKSKGARKKKGERLKLDEIGRKYWQKQVRDKEIVTNYYAGVFLHPSFGMELKVVIIEKKNEKKKKIGQVLLFSSDVNLSWEKIVEYYSLRFQIEFNFRDAKQHFGLEDFMNTSERGVENAVNLSFLMVNVSAKLRVEKGESCVGINDLKSQYRGAKYACWIIKKVLKIAEPIKINELIEEVGRLGSIHQAKSATSSA
ncbi:MAG: transposase [Bacteroidota bacterium]|nr:transposase [Bacteroidota bacterium]